MAGKGIGGSFGNFMNARLALAFCVVATAVRAENEAALAVIVRFVAIDNVCAWPNGTLPLGDD